MFDWQALPRWFGQSFAAYPTAAVGCGRMTREHLLAFRPQPPEGSPELYQWRIAQVKRVLLRQGWLPPPWATLEAYPQSIRCHGLVVCREAAEDLRTPPTTRLEKAYWRFASQNPRPKAGRAARASSRVS